MKPSDTIAVMAGAREAHGLVTALVTRGRRVIASLPEPERMFDALPVPTRLGGFASDEVLAGWLQAEGAQAVIDASHAFDADIGVRVGRVCTALQVRAIRLLRPPWVPSPCDCWHAVPDIATAITALPGTARVFSNTGWPTVPCYAGFRGQRLFMRQTQEIARPAPYPWLDFIPGMPPFTQFEEEALFRDLRITHLICRNVGGAASMSKLLAARALSLPVFMIARPAPSPGIGTVQTVAEALAWETQA